MQEILDFGKFPVAPTRENLKPRPDRRALMAVLPHPSTQMCVGELSLDGLQLGAPFQEIFPYSLAYSGGGDRAYIARENGAQFAVVNGEKQGEPWDAISDELGWCDEGQTYNYVGKRGDEMFVVGGAQNWKLGGETLPWSGGGAPLPRRFAQSPDGSQIAWIVQGRQQQLWRNGEIICEAQSFSGNPVWSPDGARMAFAYAGEKGVTIRVGEREFGPQQVSLYKGEPTWSADSRRCGWLIKRGNQSILVVNGEETVLPAKTVQCETLAFSPDGKGWALAARAGFIGLKGRAIINGESGPIYPALGVTPPAWNAAGDAVAYCAGRNLKTTFIVCDGRDGGHYNAFIDGSLTWNPGGNVVGCIAHRQRQFYVALEERDGRSHALRPETGFLIRGNRLIFDDDRALHDIGCREDGTFFGWTARF